MNKSENKILAKKLTEEGEIYFSNWFSNNNTKMSSDFILEDRKELEHIYDNLSEIIEPQFFVEKKFFGKSYDFSRQNRKTFGKIVNCYCTATHTYSR